MPTHFIEDLPASPMIEVRMGDTHRYWVVVDKQYRIWKFPFDACTCLEVLYSANWPPDSKRQYLGTALPKPPIPG